MSVFVRPALIIAVLAILSGCGGSAGASGPNASGSVVVPPSATSGFASPTPSSQIVQPNGAFFFGAAQGRLLATGTVALNGAESGSSVQLVTNPAGGARVRATLRDGTTVLADVNIAAVDLAASGSTTALSNGPKWVWLNPISHLAASYWDAHPTISQLAALQKVKSFLALPGTQSMASAFPNTPGTGFSTTTFLSQARAAGGLDTFTRQLIASIDAGKTQTFPGPTLVGLSARSAAAAPRGILSSVLGGVLGGVAKAVTTKLLGFVAGKCGLSTGTAAQLQEIEGQLNSISNELNALSNQIQVLSQNSLQQSLNTSTITPLTTFLTTQIACVTLGGQQPSLTPPGPYLPFNPASSASFLSTGNFLSLVGQTVNGQASGFYYATNLLAACLNQGTGAAGNLLVDLFWARDQAYGSSGGSDGFTFGYDFRNDSAVTPNLQQGAAYYAGQLAIAADMVAENQHQSLAGSTAIPQNTPTSPVDGISLGYSYLRGATGNQQVGGSLTQNGILALAKRMAQQAPLSLMVPGYPLPASGGNTTWGAPNLQESVAGSPNQPAPYSNGTMWAIGPYEFTSSFGDHSGATQMPLGWCGSYYHNYWYQWYFPNINEAEALCAQAQQVWQTDNPSPGATLPSQTFQIAYGLNKLGLLSDSLTSTAENGDLYIYVNNPYTNLSYASTAAQNSPLLAFNVGKDYPTMRAQSKAQSGSYIDTEVSPLIAYFVIPQSGTPVGLTLMVRPYPGEPQGAAASTTVTTPQPGFASTSTSGVPASVVGSAVYQSLQSQYGAGNVYQWQTPLCLSGSFTPQNIVIEQDATNPTQFHAYAVWQVALNQSLPSMYTTDTEVNLNYKYGIPQNIGAYVIWYEVTDIVEWLSTNTTAIEVTNGPYVATQVPGAAVTSTNFTGDDLILQNPVMSGNQLQSATLVGGTAAGGNATGTSSFGLPYSSSASGALLTGGSVTGGTLSGGTTYTVIPATASSPAPSPVTFVKGASLTGATVSGAYLTAADSGRAGMIIAHNNNFNFVTISATIMNAGQYTLPHGSSTSTYISGYYNIQSNAFTPASTPAVQSLVITPNNSTINLPAGGANLTFFLTAFNADSTVTDVSTAKETTWNVYVSAKDASGNAVTLGPSTAAAFLTNSKNVLQFQGGFNYNGIITVTASYATPQGTTVTSVAQFTVIPPPPPR